MSIIAIIVTSLCLAGFVVVLLLWAALATKPPRIRYADEDFGPEHDAGIRVVCMTCGAYIGGPIESKHLGYATCARCLQAQPEPKPGTAPTQQHFTQQYQH